MARPVLIAWRTYIAPITALRPVRWGVPLGLLLIVIIAAGRFTGLVPREALAELQRFLLLPGIPLLAAVLGEMALRDGITQRTLLYSLLGPVSRATLASVRTAATGTLLAFGALVLLIATKLIAGGPWDALLRELVTVLLAAWAYTAMASVVHLLTSRGLIVNVALYGIFDYPLGRLPIALRLLAPSHHVRTLADLHDPLPIPLTVPVPEADPIAAIAILAAVAALATLGAALLFANKRLPDLC